MQKALLFFCGPSYYQWVTNRLTKEYDVTALQDKISAMSKTELVDYHNDLVAKHGGKVVKNFRSLEDARDKVYHLAWTHGEDDEAPQAGEEETAKENGDGRKKRGAKAAAKAPAKAAAKGRRGKKAPEEEEGEEEKPAAKAASKKKSTESVEKGPLGTRPGTNKHQVVELLLAASGDAVSIKTLAKKVYKDEEAIGNVKMVLKGVEKACELDPHFKLTMDKDSATLKQVRAK